MEQDAISTSDERQPYHIINGKVMTQSEWRQKLRNATDVFNAFKRQAYKDGEI